MTKKIDEAKVEFYDAYAKIGELYVVRKDTEERLKTIDEQINKQLKDIDLLAEKYKDVLEENKSD